LDSGRQTDGALTCRVELRRSGVRFDLRPGETLLEAIEREHADVPCLCREGICGTCAVRVLQGDVDHCDAIQDDEEKAANKVMYVCVSRPTGAHLVLDL
ncbi:MAG: 2Fe-2S iron-sulfur cluster binding domain-containing protein, partial [Sinobacteraceae bacterium]|nr:2Fe-2S iron-sulfur cluster binding domain-containing protein [Nevskiaceae bacterium]